MNSGDEKLVGFSSLNIGIDILHDQSLSWVEKAVLAYVDGWTRAGKACFASSDYMATALGIGKSYVRTIRAGLIEKGKLRKYQIDGKTIYERVLEIRTPSEIQTPTVRNSNTDCPKIEHPLSEDRTPAVRNSNTYIDNYKKAIKVGIEERDPPLPPNLPEEGTKEWFDFQADKYLAVPTGTEAWERDSQYVSGGRRPMTKYPSLWFTRSELASAIEVVREALPDDDIKPVFRLAEAEAMTKQIDRGGRKIPAYKYVTGHCLQNHLETLTKTTRLAKTRSK